MKSIFIFLVLFSFQFCASAQFNITEPFKEGLAGSNLIIGGSAALTSGNADPSGDGWLRLTDTGQNKIGYLYVNENFPSTLGILVEFDFLSWKNSNTYTANGADGICMFLWNGSVPFGIGAAGGALGYTPGDTTIPVPGLAGAYLGVGLDELGNFSNPTRFITNAQNLGGPGIVGDAVVLRNCADSNYYYITGTQLPTNGAIVNGDDGGIDYKGVTATRPEPASFYRRVQLEITPESGSYRIRVAFKNSEAGNFTPLINYLSAVAPPAQLKIGFSATTGSFTNFHEIRNLNITTPGNISVLKEGPVTIDVADTFTYKVTIRNNSTNNLTGISLIDSLPATFRITSYDTVLGNAGNTISIDTSVMNLISGSCNIGANQEIILNVTGYFTNLTPVPGTYSNRVYVVAPSGFTDNDFTNDTAVVTTTISGPLPIQLISFKGVAYPDFNDLFWTWNDKISKSEFELQYSSNGTVFSKLTSIPSVDNRNDYSYRHTGKFEKLFYRLKINSGEGQFAYSNVVLLTNSIYPGYKIGPNPFMDQINIFSGTEIKEIAVTDLSGRQVFCKTGNSIAGPLTTIDLGSLSGGVYFISIMDIDGIYRNFKVTKSN